MHTILPRQVLEFVEERGERVAGWLGKYEIKFNILFFLSRQVPDLSSRRAAQKLGRNRGDCFILLEAGKQNGNPGLKRGCHVYNFSPKIKARGLKARR